MLDIVIYAAVALAAVIAAVLIYAARKPDTFSYARSTSIKAPAERIFPLINDMAAFNAWNPFAQMEPGAKVAYRGPAQGKGAAYDWDGRKAGKGSVEITDGTPSREVVMRLVMLKPMKAHNRVVFTLEPQGDATKVTWAMSGPQPFLGKLMGIFIDCEKMCGTMFETGLANLKARLESEQVARAS